MIDESAAERRLQRALRLARADGWGLVAVALPASGLAWCFGDKTGGVIGTAITVCGFMELHGRSALQAHRGAGLAWLVAAQVCCLSLLLIYAALLARDAAPARLLALLPSFTREQLDFIFPDPADRDRLLVSLQRLTAGLLALVALAYQGALTLFYLRLRSSLPALLERPPRLG